MKKIEYTSILIDSGLHISGQFDQLTCDEQCKVENIDKAIVLLQLLAFDKIRNLQQQILAIFKYNKNILVLIIIFNYIIIKYFFYKNGQDEEVLENYMKIENPLISHLKNIKEIKNKLQLLENSPQNTILNPLLKLIQCLENDVQFSFRQKKIYYFTTGESLEVSSQQQIEQLKTLINKYNIKVNIVGFDFLDIEDNQNEDSQNQYEIHNNNETLNKFDNEKVLLKLQKELKNNVKVFTYQQAITILRQFNPKQIQNRSKYSGIFQIAQQVHANVTIYTKTLERKLPYQFEKQYIKYDENNKNTQYHKVNQCVEYYVEDQFDYETIQLKNNLNNSFKQSENKVDLNLNLNQMDIVQNKNTILNEDKIQSFNQKQINSIKGYLYGKQFVPISDIYLKVKTQSCLVVLGTVKEFKVPRQSFMRGTDVIYPQRDSKSRKIISSLVQALKEQCQYLVARFVLRENLTPRFVVLIPSLAQNYECFYLNEVPTCESIRDFPFNSLKTSNKEQKKAMMNIINELDMDKNDIEFDEKQIKNPFYQGINYYLYQIIQQEQHHINDKNDDKQQKNQIISNIKEYIKQNISFENRYNEQVQYNLKQHLSQIKEKFILKVDEKFAQKKKTIFWKNLEIQNNKNQDKKSEEDKEQINQLNNVLSNKQNEQQHDYDVQDLSIKFLFTEEQEQKIEIKYIGMNNPIRDFKFLLNNPEENTVNDLVNQFIYIIQQLIETSIKDTRQHNFQLALDCINELNETCQQLQLKQLFQSYSQFRFFEFFLQPLKKIILSDQDYKELEVYTLETNQYLPQNSSDSENDAKSRNKRNDNTNIDDILYEEIQSANTSSCESYIDEILGTNAEHQEFQKSLEQTEEFIQCSNSEFINQNLLKINLQYQPPELIGLDDCKTPKDFFEKIWDDRVWEFLVLNTNLYSEQYFEKKGAKFDDNFLDKIKEDKCSYQLFKHFTPFTKYDLKRFVICEVLQGMKRLPCFLDYWSSNPLISGGLNRIMSRMRYNICVMFLHASDNSDSKYKRDEIGKIKQLQEILNANFQKFYKHSNFLAIDEGIIPFKGKSHLKVYCPGKPYKYGIKEFLLCDHSGYTLLQKIATTKDKENIYKKDTTNAKKYTHILVNQLIDNFNLENCIIFMDNFYTSVPLFKEISENNIGVVGTVRQDRLKLTSNQLKEVKKDSIKIDQNKSFVQKNLHLMFWKDNKRVVKIMSNCIGDQRITKQEKTNEKKKLIPLMVKLYNKYSHSVDKRNQLLQNYRTIRRTRKWWKTIFYRLLETSLTNSYILYKLKYEKENQDNNISILTHKEFRVKLIAEMSQEINNHIFQNLYKQTQHNSSSFIGLVNNNSQVINQSQCQISSFLTDILTQSIPFTQDQKEIQQNNQTQTISEGMNTNEGQEQSNQILYLKDQNEYLSKSYSEIKGDYMNWDENKKQLFNQTKIQQIGINPMFHQQIISLERAVKAKKLEIVNQQSHFEFKHFIIQNKTLKKCSICNQLTKYACDTCFDQLSRNQLPICAGKCQKTHMLSFYKKQKTIPNDTQQQQPQRDISIVNTQQYESTVQSTQDQSQQEFQDKSQKKQKIFIQQELEAENNINLINQFEDGEFEDCEFEDYVLETRQKKQFIQNKVNNFEDDQFEDVVFEIYEKNNDIQNKINKFEEDEFETYEQYQNINLKTPEFEDGEFKDSGFENDQFNGEFEDEEFEIFEKKEENVNKNQELIKHNKFSQQQLKYDQNISSLKENQNNNKIQMNQQYNFKQKKNFLAEIKYFQDKQGNKNKLDIQKYNKERNGFGYNQRCNNSSICEKVELKKHKQEQQDKKQNNREFGNQIKIQNQINFKNKKQLTSDKNSSKINISKLNKNKNIIDNKLIDMRKQIYSSNKTQYKNSKNIIKQDNNQTQQKIDNQIKYNIQSQKENNDIFKKYSDEDDIFEKYEDDNLFEDDNDNMFEEEYGIEQKCLNQTKTTIKQEQKKDLNLTQTQQLVQQTNSLCEHSNEYFEDLFEE